MFYTFDLYTECYYYRSFLMINTCNNSPPSMFKRKAHFLTIQSREFPNLQLIDSLGQDLIMINHNDASKKKKKKRIAAELYV